jgi:DNA-binding LytR/AlgR family response regulator
MKTPLKVVIADGESASRLLLKTLLAGYENVDVIGEAESGPQLFEINKTFNPDLILVDLSIPDLNNPEFSDLVRNKKMPLIGVLASSDKYAVEAFKIGAIDYLLKPVELAKLAETLNRTYDRLNSAANFKQQSENGNQKIVIDKSLNQVPLLEHLPIKDESETVLLPVAKIASIVADLEWIVITAAENQKFSIKYSLKDLEKRLDNTKFMRLSRGTIVNIEMIEKIFDLPGGSYQILLKNNERHSASRIQSRVIRHQFLKLQKLH